MSYENYIVASEKAFSYDPKNLFAFTIHIFDLRIQWKRSQLAFKNEYGVYLLEFIRLKKHFGILYDTFCNIPWDVESLTEDDLIAIRDLIGEKVDLCINFAFQDNCETALNVIIKAGLDISTSIHRCQSIIDTSKIEDDRKKAIRKKKFIEDAQMSMQVGIVSTALMRFFANLKK